MRLIAGWVVIFSILERNYCEKMPEEHPKDYITTRYKVSWNADIVCKASITVTDYTNKLIIFLAADM